jgi:hypothetical protein
MAVSKVSAIARPIPTIASFAMYVPLLVFAGFYLEIKSVSECELLHTSPVVQKMMGTRTVNP